MAESRKTSRRHGAVALSCVLFVSLMVGAAYAAVPLYAIFCQVTGFGGTPSVGTVEALPGLKPGNRELTIRFDANVDPSLPWKFKPVQRTMKVRVGEVAQAMYEIENISGKDTVGRAVYNITPYQGGGYFTKVQCFCFDLQPLKAHEKLEVPVVFYVDPAYAEDPDADGVNTLTLSYTFFSQTPVDGEPPAG
ncbi:cytochrome c oxidase assembly protein [Acuticoccus sp. MNP-M23]|nr:cytochrome c oxidase assembly protein [Acuticoccus sp. MNP-M23]WMS45008.1 cytochrome c oxidase assembly protein [Acuticoccus sp. MNP-M23]